jgi:hypothetical protein
MGGTLTGGVGLAMRRLQAPKPPSQLSAVPSHATGRWHSEGIGDDSGKRLPLEIQIGACVTHGRGNAGKSEELA